MPCRASRAGLRTCAFLCIAPIYTTRVTIYAHTGTAKRRRAPLSACVQPARNTRDNAGHVHNRRRDGRHVRTVWQRVHDTMRFGAHRSRGAVDKRSRRGATASRRLSVHLLRGVHFGAPRHRSALPWMWRTHYRLRDADVESGGRRRCRCTNTLSALRVGRNAHRLLRHARAHTLGTARRGQRRDHRPAPRTPLAPPIEPPRGISSNIHQGRRSAAACPTNRQAGERGVTPSPIRRRASRPSPVPTFRARRGRERRQARHRQPWQCADCRHRHHRLRPAAWEVRAATRTRHRTPWTRVAAKPPTGTPTVRWAMRAHHWRTPKTILRQSTASRGTPRRSYVCASYCTASATHSRSANARTPAPTCVARHGPRARRMCAHSTLCTSAMRTSASVLVRLPSQHPGRRAPPPPNKSPGHRPLHCASRRCSDSRRTNSEKLPVVALLPAEVGVATPGERRRRGVPARTTVTQSLCWRRHWQRPSGIVRRGQNLTAAAAAAPMRS